MTSSMVRKKLNMSVILTFVTKCLQMILIPGLMLEVFNTDIWSFYHLHLTVIHKQCINYQDMIIKYGKPNLFLVFICNPKWAEIIDLVSRFQNEVERELIKDINERDVLGTTLAHVYQLNAM